MKEKLRSTEIWCKIALVFIFAGFWVLAAPFPEKARHFPRLMAGFSLAMTVVSLLIDLCRRDYKATVIGDVDDTELKTVDDATRRERRGRFYRAWAITLVSVGVGFLGGFLLTCFLLFAGFAVVFGKRESLAKNLAVAAVVTAVVWYGFDRVMQVPLLDGLLWSR